MITLIKNDYILILGDINARTGNTKIMKIIGTNRGSTINNNGRKLADICVFDNIRIMNSFFKDKVTNLHGVLMGKINNRLCHTN
jgi:hypothetical protein